MMGWAKKVSEQELAQKGEIPTDFGETLSWKYLCFVREHPIDWKVPTEILYAEHDHFDLAANGHPLCRDPQRTPDHTGRRRALVPHRKPACLFGPLDAAGTGVRPIKAVCQSPRKRLHFLPVFRLHNQNSHAFSFYAKRKNCCFIVIFCQKN